MTPIEECGDCEQPLEDCTCDDFADCDCEDCRGDCFIGCGGCDDCWCHDDNCMIYASQISCGVKEWSGISSYQDPKVALQTLARYIADHEFGAAHILFSDSIERPIGQQIADLIVKEKLGTVVATPQAVNPNSKNTIVVWCWTWDRPAFDKWATPIEVKSAESALNTTVS